MYILNALLLMAAILSCSSPSFSASNKEKDGDCSRFSTVNFKTTLLEDSMQRFTEWKENNFANLNTGKSRKMKLEQLQQAYCTGRRDFYKIGIDASWDVLQLSVTLALYKYASPAIGPAAAMVPAAAMGAAMMGFLAPFQSFAASLIKTIKESKMDQNEGLKYVHEELVEKSTNIILELPEDIRGKVQSFDRSINTFLANKQTDVAFRFLRRREQVYLSFPAESLNISHRDIKGDKEIREILDHRVKDLISRYPSVQQTALNLLVSAIRNNAVASSGNRVQAYLYGPPGTGKTTFVKQLGEALGLPVCSISMGSLEPSQLLGPEYGDDYCEKSDEEVLGKIASCYISSGYKNPIIFFDEAGEYLSDSKTKASGFDLNFIKRQQIQGEFKKITDPSSATLNHIGLGINIDTSRTTFLFASNYPLTNTALLSRITQISLSKLTRVEKEVAANGSLEQFLCEKAQLISDEEIVAIRVLAKAYLPFIIDEDEKINPGARTIQAVIGELVEQIDNLKVQETASAESFITDDLLKDIIRDSFMRRQPLSEAAEPASVSRYSRAADTSDTVKPQQPSCDI